MSRGQWLALGSTMALAGCSGAVAATPGDGGGGTGHDPATGALEGGSGVIGHEAGADPGDAGEPEDAGNTADSELLVDTGSSVVADAADDGGFACPTRSGYFQCGGNVCDRSIQACYSGGCQWYGNLYEMPDAASCGACPTCQCLKGALYPNCSCQEDDAGTLTISCGGCYGSPPARLERIA
ncbi:MAG TPA: hypothetical protein VIF15_06040 [Polyangiaceae bacterium]|jgi:hypothetical protein